MRMRIQMFLTIFIIPVALRAEPKLHIRTIHLSPTADCTFMLGYTAASTSDIPLKLLPPVYLLRIQMHHIP